MDAGTQVYSKHPRVSTRPARNTQHSIIFFDPASSPPATIFDAKAKKGPFKLEEFQDKYRYQLQKEEQARKKEGEALQKRQEALEDLVKKKGEQEKKQFKKGQADLEKELGF